MEKNKAILEEFFDETGMNVQTFQQLKREYNKVCQKLGAVPKSPERRSPSPPKTIPKEKVEGKYGKFAVKQLKDAEIVDASTEGGNYQRDRFGVGYSGQLPLDRQAVLEENLAGGLKNIFVKGLDHHSEETYTAGLAGPGNGLAGLGGLADIMNNYGETEDED